MPMQVGPNYANFSFNIATQTGATTLGSSPGFIINDSVALVQIPNFCMLTDFYVDTCFLDTGTAVRWSLGDNVSASHGGLGAGGFATAISLGISSLSGVFRAGGFAQVGTGAAQTTQQWVHATIPWVYAIPFANVPVATVSGTGGVSGGIWLTMTITTAPTTTATSGIISGWVAYTLLTSTTAASGTAPAAGAL